MKTLFSLALMVTTLISAHARIPEEGLFEKRPLMPEVVESAWDSSFAVVIENKYTLRTGTASLVKIQHLETETELYFLTANHVVQDLCPASGNCEIGRLLQEMEFNTSDYTVTPKAGLTFNEFEVVKTSANPDIALIKVSVPSDGTAYPVPLKLASQCNLKKGSKLYAVGFSDASERISTPGHEIQNSEFVHKRWSQGISLEKEPVLGFGNGINYLFGTTVDLLGGGSGGALLNERGEIQGILKASGPPTHYAGIESPGKEDYASLMVECEHLTKFFAE